MLKIFNLPICKPLKKFKVLGGSTRRPERRNRNVHEVHEDFEYRATP
jgi:hypothetical protein